MNSNPSRAIAAALTGILVSGLAGCAVPVEIDPSSSSPSAPAQVPTAFPLDQQLFALEETLDLELTGVWLTSGAQALQYGEPEGNGIWLWVFAAGVEDPFRTQTENEYREAPPLFDRPANYIYQQTGEGPRLGGIAFQWTDGAWAELIHVPTAGGEDLLRQLAGSLRSDVDEPVRFGFTVQPPPSLRLAMAQPFTAGEEGGASQLWFTTDAEPAVTPLHTSDSQIIASVGYSNVTAPRANATVGGRPAFVIDEPGHYAVELLDAPGYTVKVTVIGDDALLRFSAQEANDLALSIQPLGTWTDRSQWTDDPIR